jgi:hypothetical protein
MKLRSYLLALLIVPAALALTLASSTASGQEAAPQQRATVTQSFEMTFDVQ